MSCRERVQRVSAFPAVFPVRTSGTPEDRIDQDAMNEGAETFVRVVAPAMAIECCAAADRFPEQSYMKKVPNLFELSSRIRGVNACRPAS